MRPVLAGDRLIIQVSKLVAIQRDRTDPRVAPQDLGIAEIHTRGTVEDILVAEAEALYLCVPMLWVFGARKEEIVTRALELLGCADARP